LKTLVAITAALFLATLPAAARAEPEPDGFEASRSPEEEPGKKKTPKKKKFKIKIMGEVEFEYVDVEKERLSPGDETSLPEGHFQLDFAAAIIKASLLKELYARIEVRFTPRDTLIDVQEAVFHFGCLPLGGYVEAGLFSKIMRPARKTEAYPLAGLAFCKGQDLGLAAGLKFDVFDASKQKEGKESPGKIPAREKGELRIRLLADFSLTNGLPLGKRRVGEDDSFHVIGFDEQNYDAKRTFETGVSVGFNVRVLKGLSFAGWGFYFSGRLSEADRQFLWDLPGYGTHASRGSAYSGLTGRIRAFGFELLAHTIGGRQGMLGRAAWFLQASFQLKLPGFDVGGVTVLKSVEAIARHGELDVDMARSEDEPLTWSRRKTVAGVRVTLVKGVSLKAEYVVNRETTGGPHVHNNEAIFQLEVKF
jgi:hypothetical protein